MQISEAIHLTNDVYSKLDHRGFRQNVGTGAQDVWSNIGQNIVFFLERVAPEFRTRFWDWITTLGITDMDQVRRLYSILSLLYSKADSLPSEYKAQFDGSNNMAIFIGNIQRKNELTKIIHWAQSVVDEQELKLAQGTFRMTFSGPRPNMSQASIQPINLSNNQPRSKSVQPKSTFAQPHFKASQKASQKANQNFNRQTNQTNPDTSHFSRNPHAMANKSVNPYLLTPQVHVPRQQSVPIRNRQAPAVRMSQAVNNTKFRPVTSGNSGNGGIRSLEELKRAFGVR